MHTGIFQNKEHILDENKIGDIYQWDSAKETMYLVIYMHKGKAY